MDGGVKAADGCGWWLAAGRSQLVAGWPVVAFLDLLDGLSLIQHLFGLCLMMPFIIQVQVANLGFGMKELVLLHVLFSFFVHGLSCDFTMD